MLLVLDSKNCICFISWVSSQHCIKCGQIFGYFNGGDANRMNDGESLAVRSGEIKMIHQNGSKYSPLTLPQTT